MGEKAGANAAENNALFLLLIPAAAAVLEAVDKGIVAYDAYRLAQAIEAGDDEAAAQIAKEFAVSAGIELSIGAALPGSAVAVKLADSLKKAGLDDLASTFNAASNGVEGAGSSAMRVSVDLKQKVLITAKNPSVSEVKSAEYLASLGKRVELRDPIGTRVGGLTSDLLVDGIPYDVFTPQTGNVDRIVSAVAKKNSQAQGIVIDLSNTSVTPTQLDNILVRVQGAGATNISDIVIIGK